MFLKVLIADDEPKIRRGLRRLLTQFPEEFSVVGEAEDGEQALELVQTLEPDLILVDIRMPFVDGLEFVRALASRRDGPERRIVVISGHDEFEYARQALSLGVFDYLLKPVEDDHLIETLRRAAADLDHTRSLVDEREQVLSLASKNRDVLLEGIFREVLTGTSSTDLWVRTAHSLDFPVRPVPTLVFVSVQLSETDAGRALWNEVSLRRAAQECFEGFSQRIIVCPHPGTLGIFSDETDEALWTRALERFEVRVRDLLGSVVNIQSAPVTGFPETLPAVWATLRKSRAEVSAHGALTTLALNLIDHRFRESDLTLESIASELQVSSGHLSRVLKQTTSLPFIELVARARILRATILLADPAVRVYEVAEQVGYTSQHYFSRAFHRVLGISPTEFRKGKR